MENDFRSSTCASGGQYLHVKRRRWVNRTLLVLFANIQ
jgi:hypothetical protein